MQTLWTILIILGCLLVMLAGIWALLIRGNSSKRGFYGLGDTLYAHRGLHNSLRGVPENSIKAFQLAVHYGYGAELDVHLSRDKRLVVMHDESLKRTAGLDMNICQATTEVLSRLRLEGTEQTVPYLEDVLPIFDNKTPLIIEIKPHGKNYARLTYRVCKLLDEYPGVKFCIESFDPRVLLWLRKNRPEIVRGQLSMNHLKKRESLKWGTAFALTNLLLNFLTQPDFVAYKYEDRKNLSFGLCRLLWRVQQVHWTIHAQEETDVCLKKHAMVIFEGFPARMEPLPAPEAQEPQPERAPEPAEPEAADPAPESAEPTDEPSAPDLTPAQEPDDIEQRADALLRESEPPEPVPDPAEQELPAPDEDCAR